MKPSHPIPSQYNCYQMKICRYECLLNNIGEKLGKLPAVFSTMYLSGGTCVLSIITGEKTLEYPYQVLCGDDFECNSRSLKRDTVVLGVHKLGNFGGSILCKHGLSSSHFTHRINQSCCILFITAKNKHESLMS